jgi:superfamily I DNA/RNA helicase/RecB family exonuclease
MEVNPLDIAGRQPSTTSLILGAPGSGKTTLVLERIVSLASSGISPDNLLILTPSRAQASLVRDRVALALGVTTAGPRVRSVASFAFALVRAAHHDAGLAEPDLMSASQTDADIEALISGHISDGSGPAWPEPLGSMVRELPVFRQELREWMARATENGLDDQTLQRLARDHQRPEWAAAAAFRSEYATVLASARPGAFDSAEIIRRAIVVLERGLPAEFAGLVHIAVDDLHDVTQATLDFLGVLRALGIGLTLTGEPDVAGNTFRGSQPQGLSRLAGAWSITPEVLPSVHRHGSALRAVVAAVSEKIGTAGMGVQRKTPSSVKEPGRVLTLVAPSPHREANDIARFITQVHLDDNVPYHRIAVVARRGSRVQALVRELSNHAIPARANLAGMTLRDQPAARDLLEIVALGLGVTPLNAKSAVSALTGRYGLMTTQELRRLRFALRVQAATDEHYTPADQLIAEGLAHRGGFSLLEPSVGAKAQALAEILDDIRSADPGTPVTQLLWSAWSRSGLSSVWASRAVAPGERSGGAHRALDAVGALFHQAAEFVEAQPGASSALFLEAVLESDVPDDVVLPSPAWPAVTVSTPSGLAGLECDVVIVSGVEDGVWPDLRLRGSLLGAHQMVRSAAGEHGDVLDERKIVRDDELRLFAMALSRATHTVLVSSTDSEDSPPSPLFHLVDSMATRVPSTPEPPRSPRSVVGRLRRSLVGAVASGSETQAMASDLALMASWGVPGANPESWWGLGSASSDSALYPEGEVPVSPSALATLEESPVEWFLGSLARNDSGPEAGLGSLIHRALEAHPDGSADELWSVVDASFAQLDYDAGWVEAYQRRIARGMVEALADYLADRRLEGYETLGIEQRFDLRLGRAVVRGVIDRIELTPEKKLLVVDLKTGRHVTDSAVVDNPQMLTYQLALENEELLATLNRAPTESAGAVLLFVKSGVRGKAYRFATQEPVTDEARALFLERLETAVSLISAASFSGSPRLFGGSSHSKHRWHFVGQVCGDD